MTALVPVVAGTTFATLFSAALLALPAILAVRRLVERRLVAPFARDRVERALVLASSLAGAAGAVACSDLSASLTSETGQFASLLLGFVAPVPLAAVPWAAGELLSGASIRRWLALTAAVAASCATSWTAYALCFSNDFLRFEPELGLMHLASGVVSGLCAAHAYLAVRGEQVQALPQPAVSLWRL